LDMNLTPLIAVVFIWLFVGLMNRLPKKARKGGPNAAPRPPRAPKATMEAPKTSEGPEMPVEGRAADGSDTPWSTIRPTVAPGLRDDSLYQGSLNAITGEGEDPCHAEQFTVLDLAESAHEPEAVTTPAGLNLNWTADEVTRGFILGEILKRKE